jgi:hypothetical protein
MAKFHIHPWAKVGSLKNATVLELTAELSNMKIENDLRREVQENIRRLKDMGTYRGRRHAMGLPVRGQRTRTQVGWTRIKVGWILTVLDYYGAKIEQDRTRRSGSSTAVRRSGDNVLYCTAMMILHGMALYSQSWGVCHGINFTLDRPSISSIDTSGDCSETLSSHQHCFRCYGLVECTGPRREVPLCFVYSCLECMDVTSSDLSQDMPPAVYANINSQTRLFIQSNATGHMYQGLYRSISS